MTSAEPKPRFHVMPPRGWINDPNGPLFYKGYYHIFYQYVETGCQWSWGLLWGHAVSRDLVHWEHLPPALAPSFGGFDGDGCFSGCATLDEEGVPTIMYTGVRLRSSAVCGPLPPPECDLGTACIETQCIAYGDPADPKLTYWTKEEVPFLSLPPPNMELTAWRDPYVIGRPGQHGQDCWTVMVGAGVKERGGTALVYRAQSLRGGSWSYEGELCRGTGDTGVIWECPVMLPLTCLPQQLPPLPLPSSSEAAAPALAINSSLSFKVLKAQSPLPAPNFDEQEEEDERKATVGKAAAKAVELPGRMGPLPLPPSPRPRPPIRLLADAASAAGATDAVAAAAATAAAAAGAGGSSRLGLVAAVLSPRRPMTAVPVSPTPPSPLRSPARWNLPSMNTLPQAPSPPPPAAPRSPAFRSMGIAAAGPFSPTIFGAPAAAPFCNDARMHATPPTSPRPTQLPRLPSPPPPPPFSVFAATAGDDSAAAALPRPSPAGAVAALLNLSVPLASAAAPTSATKQDPFTPSPASASTSAPSTSALSTSAPSTADACTAATSAPRPATAASWQSHSTFFCVCPDDCNSAAVYYLGAYDPRVAAFDLEGALGPFLLDLGDIFYAPNSLTDPEGRAVLWGWLQEKPRKVGEYDYAGCLSLPRLLHLEVHENAGATAAGDSSSSSNVGDGAAPRPPVYLVQRPPPEMAQLRLPGSEWLAEGLLLEPGATSPVPLPATAAHHLELLIHMAPLPQPQLPQPTTPATPATPRVGITTTTTATMPGTAAATAAVATPPAGTPGVVPCPATSAATSRCSGVLLHSWRGGAEGAAALLYHWDSGVLEVVFEALDPATLTFSLAAPGARRVGGPLLRPPAPGSQLSLRVFLDYSCLEVFTGDGEVLTARVYRGTTPLAPSYHHCHQGQGLTGPFAHEGGHHGPHHRQDAYGAGGAAAAGVELVSFGCSTEFGSVAAYEVGPIWVDQA